MRARVCAKEQNDSERNPGALEHEQANVVDGREATGGIDVDGGGHDAPGQCDGNHTTRP
jgi:hypothetical protein